MSGGERKGRLTTAGRRGWEEAGCEFYQESFPGADVDLEAMKNDPQCISTLLPSKKTRTGTITFGKKDNRLATLRYRTAMQPQHQMNATVGPSSDVQISFMPDLSENLSNEELLWEEIMKIKAMPVNMAQKKEMKAKLQSKDTLRLQGFKQFRWKRRQTWIHLKMRLKELNEKLTLWGTSLKKIEGYHGTGVMSFFMFIKWLVFLNITISVIIYSFVILPVLYTEYQSNFISLSNKTGCIKTMNDTDPLFQFVLGKGWLAKIPLYYDYYEDSVIDFGFFSYKLPLAYILATFIYFFYSFAAILKNAAQGFKHKLLEREGQFYTYCNIIFSGWDYCVRSEGSARIKHKALYNEIVGRLNMERQKEEQRSRTKGESFRLFIIRLFVNLVVLSLLSIAGIIIFVSYNRLRRTRIMNDPVLELAVEFAPAGFITGFNIILPGIFRWLSNFERFSVTFVIQVTVFRTILLRYSSLCVLLASFYESIKDSTRRKECWENIVARELYKLLILTVITQLVVTFFLNFPRSFIARHSTCKIFQFFAQQEFHLPTHVLDVIYIQTIIWLGAFYAPLVPTLGVIIFVMIFYIKKFSCLVNSRPAVKLYYASRSHSLFMFILLFSFVFSVIPWAFSITELSPSKVYGPFKNYDTVWLVVEETFASFPLWIQDVGVFCTRSMFVAPLFVVLILVNYYYYMVYTANKEMVVELKRQLVLEGHDKQFLLNRLSAFIKQQQAYCKQGTMSDL